MSYPLRRYSITDRNGRWRRKSEFFFCPRRLLFIGISDHPFPMMTDRLRILILKERSDLIELELSLNDSMLMLMLLSKISSLYDFVTLLLHLIALNRVVCHQRVERIIVNIVSASGAHLFMNNKLMSSLSSCHSQRWSSSLNWLVNSRKSKVLSNYSFVL